MKTLKENLKNNLGLSEENIKENEDGSITFELDGNKITVDEKGQVEVGEKLPIIKAKKIEVEDLIMEDGIKAKKLKVTTTPSEITENLIYTSKNTEVITVDAEGNVTAKEEGEAQVEVKGEKSGVKGECTVTVQFGVGVKVTGSNKSYTDADGDTAVIPVGFAIVPNLNDISEGLVISDVANDINDKGNQFVWIPVKNQEDYTIDTTNNDINYLPLTDAEIGIEEGANDEQKRQLTFEKEKSLVTKEGIEGFYISRYEAGDSSAEEERTSATEGTLVSKKNVYVYNYISQDDAKAKAKTFKNDEYVKSALCTGVQWNMVMAFISSEKRLDGTNKEYDVNTASEFRHTGSRATSGQNLADKICNIYDLEGNISEYVAEKGTYYPYVNRGGNYNYYSYFSASYVGNGDGSAYDSDTFRIVLYVM